MAESSFFWQTNDTGDGPAAGYSQADIFSIWRMFTQTDNLGGVFPDYLNNLAVSSTSSPVVVAPGAAIVYGSPYENTVAENVAVPTPGGATRIDRIVLRADWTAQTVRIVRVAGSEGGGAPSLTQSAGATWEIPLAQASITTGGVITLTDEREFLNIVANKGVTDDKLRDSIALSVIGRASNSSGVPADIGAGSDGQVLRRSGTTLGFGLVDGAGIADSAITNSKLANDAVDTAEIVNLAITAAKINDLAVTDSKLRNSQALSVIGRAVNSSGSPADIDASSDHQVLRRSGSSLGFGAIDVSQDNSVAGILPTQHGGTGFDNDGKGIQINTNSGALTFPSASITLTVAASGTAALLGTTQTFTGAKTFNATTTFTGAATFNTTTTFGAGTDGRLRITPSGADITNVFARDSADSGVGILLVSANSFRITDGNGRIVMRANAVESSSHLRLTEDVAVATIIGSKTTTQRNALSDLSDGMIIYNSSTNKFQGRANSTWVDLH